MSLSDLIARVEGAGGPDRALDAEIVVQFDIRPDWLKDSPGILWVGPDGDVLYSYNNKKSRGNPSAWYLTDFYPGKQIPFYTASLDAAVALAERVLPGWSWEVRKSGFGTPAQANLWNPRKSPAPDNNYRVDHESGCAPLALVTATLKAVQAQREAAEQ